MNPTARPRWALGLIVATYVLLTLALVVQVRINATPDEPAHVQYVQHLATLGELPVFEARGAQTADGEQPPGYEYHQPPLYYWLCVPLWKATGPGVQQYMCRLVSLLCGAFTLVLLWHAVRTLFPDNATLPVIATGFAALWPMHQGVGASAGNDALAGLISAAIFLCIARGARHGWGVKGLVVLGVFCGLGLLTKTSCLVLLLLSMGAAWYYCRQAEKRGQATLSPILGTGTVLGIAVLLSGWWLLRNQNLYGDPFALNTFNRAFGNDPSAQVMVWVSKGMIPKAKYLQALIFVLLSTTWGIFGGTETARHIYNPLGTRGVTPEAMPGLMVLGLCVVASAIACVGLVRFARSWALQDAAMRSAILWWLAGLALVALSFVSFNTHYFQAQARYFHPALVPMATAFALGWQQAWCGVGRDRALWISSAGFGAVLIGLTLWNVFIWQTLV